MITLNANDSLSTTTKTIGFLKSRKGEHVNSPSARDGQTTVFFEVDLESKGFGQPHEIELPALITDRATMTSVLNPAVLAEIRKIIG